MATRSKFPLGVLGVVLVASAVLQADNGSVRGQVTDPQGKSVAGASVSLVQDGDSRPQTTQSDLNGRYAFYSLPAGVYKLAAAAQGFVDVSQTINLADGGTLTVNLRFDRLAPHTEAVKVTADVTDLDINNPDPAQRVFVREEILDANPGRPGAPVSIPGVPIETASSGIKAPQYFAPGVAGDHGESIATFIQVGSFLMPNNLSANAHGNGYSDPNIMVPAIIESVQTDGGAFNVREGNHSVNVAALYALRPSLEPFATFTADYRDVDLSTGWKWLAMQASPGQRFPRQAGTSPAIQDQRSKGMGLRRAQAHGALHGILWPVEDPGFGAD